MPGCSEVCIWFLTKKYDALKQVLREQNLKLEDKLTEKLEELYCQYVPQTLRDQIAAAIKAETQQEEDDAVRRAAEQYRESAIKIVGLGRTRYWKIESAISDLQFARHLRKVLRQKTLAPSVAFEQLLEGKTEITQSQFAGIVQMYLQCEKPAANVVTFDFDRKTVTFAAPLQGFTIYTMKDASTAVFQAERATGLSEHVMENRFYEHLTAKTGSFIPMIPERKNDMLLEMEENV